MSIVKIKFSIRFFKKIAGCPLYLLQNSNSNLHREKCYCKIVFAKMVICMSEEENPYAGDGVVEGHWAYTVRKVLADFAKCD